MSSRYFSPFVKEALRQRAGERCSYRDCQKATSGPDPFNQNLPVKSGQAAHIAAVSKGGPRFDPDMSDERCASIENGIWLCETCHREFDRRTHGWSLDVVIAIKQDAEHRAHMTHVTGPGHAIGVEYQTRDVVEAYIKTMREILGSLRDANHWRAEEYGFAGGAKAVEAYWDNSRTVPYVREPDIARLIEIVRSSLAALGGEFATNWSIRAPHGSSLYAFDPNNALDRTQQKNALDHADGLVQAFHQALENLEHYLRLR